MFLVRIVAKVQKEANLVFARQTNVITAILFSNIADALMAAAESILIPYKNQ